MLQSVYYAWEHVPFLGICVCVHVWGKMLWLACACARGAVTNIIFAKMIHVDVKHIHVVKAIRVSFVQ